MHLQGRMRWVFIKLENRTVSLLQRDSYGKNKRPGSISRKLVAAKCFMGNHIVVYDLVTDYSKVYCDIPQILGSYLQTGHECLLPSPYLLTFLADNAYQRIILVSPYRFKSEAILFSICFDPTLSQSLPNHLPQLIVAIRGFTSGHQGTCEFPSHRYSAQTK